MKAQWSDSRTVVPTYISSHIAGKCGILDRYVVYQTGEYEYQGIVIKLVGKGELYTYTRSSNYSQWDVSSQETMDYSYSVQHELYVCSTMGLGTVVAPPSWDYTVTLSIAVIACAVSIRWLVFPWIERRCRR